MNKDRTGLAVAGVGLAAIACCSLPLLATGAIAAFGGIVAGSGALVAVGLALAAWAGRRRRRCPVPPRTNVERNGGADIEGT
jgi:hypothetical protein